MKYYANFGHSEFVLGLGYKADVIEKYFRDYDRVAVERQRGDEPGRSRSPTRGSRQ